MNALERNILNEVNECGYCCEHALINHYHDDSKPGEIKQAIQSLVVSDKIKKVRDRFGVGLIAK